jgi:hypothetical protein
MDLNQLIVYLVMEQLILFIFLLIELVFKYARTDILVMLISVHK